MPSATKRFQPYYGRDGDVIRLLDFAHAAGQLLDPNFNPPKVMLSKDETEGLQDVMHYNKRWGNQEQGFETFHTVELEPRAGGHAVDRVWLATFGLANDAKIEMECTRSWYDPRFIEIRVEGLQAAVDEIIAKFVDQFGGSQMDPAKLKETLLSAEVSLKAGAWDAAIMKAQEVIKLDDAQPDAYFVLGAASMANGDLPTAKENLMKAVELAPNHLHAWFNLAKVYEQLNELREALNAYRQIINAPPDPNQPPEFMNTVMAAIGELMKKISGDAG